MAEYKEKKVTTVVMEIENTGASQYNINGVDLGKAIFLFRRTQEITRAIPLADYTITVNGDQYLNINDGDTKDTADIYQVVYEEQLDSSQYNPIGGEPNIYTMVDNYNAVQKDLVELWESFRTTSMKSDIIEQGVTLPVLGDGESWYWDDVAKEYKGIGVATVELNIQRVTDEGDFQISRLTTLGDQYVIDITALGDQYIIDMTALRDDTIAYKDETFAYRNEAEGFKDDAEASAQSIASQDAQITQNTTDIGTNVTNIGNNTTAISEVVIMPIGSVINFYGTTLPDTNWLICNGSTFNASTYPQLNALLGGNTLPDLRGEFVRGLDNGRGVDSGRTLGSTQSDQNKSHTHTRGTMEITGAIQNHKGRYRIAPTGVGAFTVSSGSATAGSDQNSDTSYTSTFTASRTWSGSTSSNGGSEARVRNVAMNFIIRAK